MTKRRKRKKHTEPRVDLTVAVGDVLRQVDRRRSKLQKLVESRRKQLLTLEENVVVGDRPLEDDLNLHKVRGKITSIEWQLSHIDEKLKTILKVALGDEKLSQANPTLNRLLETFEADLKNEISSMTHDSEATVESVILQSANENLENNKRSLKYSGRSLKSASDVFEKISMDVLAKELAANNFKRPVESSRDFEIVLESYIKKIENLRSFVSAKFSFFQRFDKSVERAFSRLEKHLDDTREALDQSFENEEKLAKSLEHAEAALSGQKEKLENFESCPYDHVKQVPLETIEDQDRHLKIFRSRISTLEETRTSLKIALESLRKRNIFATDSVFYSEAVVRRFYIMKLLLHALPGSNREESLVRLLMELINALSSRLASHNQTASSLDYTDIHEQVSKLEYRIMMIYVQLAKESEASLSQRAKELRNSKLLSVSVELEKERVIHATKANEWKAFHENAIQENKQLLKEVASARSNYCSGMVKTIDQSILVLSIIIGKSNNAST